MRSPVAAAVAIALGLVVLLGYFTLYIPAGSSISQALQSLAFLRTLFINWAVTLAGFAFLVAIFALVGSHWRKLRARRNPDRYSFFMLGGFVLVFLYGLYSYVWTGNTVNFQMVVNWVQVPIEASLMAVLTVTLALAIFRLFQRRRGLLPVVFLLSVLVYLLLNSGLLASVDSPTMGVFLVFLQTLPIAGGRGILLGIALGSIITGLRILIGAQRPYSG